MLIRTLPFVRGVLCVLCVLLFAPVDSWAQQTSTISGTVRDASGAVLPGVSVEVASPALIEKVRSAVSDGQGYYRVVDLRPGTYTVTFGLAGFTTIKREGIELTTGFEASVNAEMAVGSVEESITVSGASPLVDTQNVRQQRVYEEEQLEALPTATRSLNTVIQLTPGMTGNPDSGGSAGIFANATGANTFFRGKTGYQLLYDGMRTNGFEAAGSTSYIASPVGINEMALSTGAVSAESPGATYTLNFIPKEGGNAFTFVMEGLYTTSALQADNLTAGLRDRGLQTVNKVLRLYDVSSSVGGPIVPDKLWFFGLFRAVGNRNRLAGFFFNAVPHTPFYTPDLSRPAFRYEHLEAGGGRLTWQAKPAHRIGLFTEIQNNCSCRHTSGGQNVAPEAVSQFHFKPRFFQGTWRWTASSRLLLEAGATVSLGHWPNFPQDEVLPTDISTTDLRTGFRYNASQFSLSGANYGQPKVSDRYVQRASLSYVTGSHAFKAGFQIDEGRRDNYQYVHGDRAYNFLGSAPGTAIPSSIIQFATPFRDRQNQKADMGIFAQDQWTIKRLTLNAGLRYDWLNVYTPEQRMDAGSWVPARTFAAVSDIPNWQDLAPRIGVSYDLRGDGRTAIKAAFGRYFTNDGLNLTREVFNPAIAAVNQASRSWNDQFYGANDPRSRNYIPDCDLTSRVANGECGALDNQAFGSSNPNATRFSDDVTRGFGKRPRFWEFSTEIQHELVPRVSLSGGYYRTEYANFRVTDNLLVSQADFSPFCITAPTDARLPGGGGYQVCGLYDIVPNQFGRVLNNIARSDEFGKQTDILDFYNISVQSRLAGNILLAGGFDTGRRVLDNCFVVDSPQQLLNCRVERPFRSFSQAKFHASYPLPYDIQVAAMFQNLAGPEILATFNAPNSLVAPSLGRNLGACGSAATCTLTAPAIPLIVPGTQFEGRRTQLDLRLSKILNLGPRVRLRANLDVFNVFNRSAILARNNTYSQTTQWGRPIAAGLSGNAVQDGRLIEFGGRLSF